MTFNQFQPFSISKEESEDWGDLFAFYALKKYSVDFTNRLKAPLINLLLCKLFPPSFLQSTEENSAENSIAPYQIWGSPPGLPVLFHALLQSKPPWKIQSLLEFAAVSGGWPLPDDIDSLIEENSQKIPEELQNHMKFHHRLKNLNLKLADHRTDRLVGATLQNSVGSMKKSEEKNFLIF